MRVYTTQCIDSRKGRSIGYTVNQTVSSVHMTLAGLEVFTLQGSLHRLGATTTALQLRTAFANLFGKVRLTCGCSEQQTLHASVNRHITTTFTARMSGCVQIHEEAQHKAEAEAAAVLQERQWAAEEALRMAAAAKQRALSVHQIQAQQEAEARKKYALYFRSCCSFMHTN